MINYLLSDTSQCVQTIDFGSVLCLSLKMTLLSNTNCLLLACGLSNSKIQLYLNDFSNGDSVFLPSHSLIGHEDWVRSLDFISEGEYGIWLSIYLVNLLNLFKSIFNV